MRFSEFIRANNAKIIAAWETDVRRALSLPKPFDRPALVDHVDRLLNDFAEIVRTGDESIGPAKKADDHSDEHAWDRIEQGFPLSHVVTELSLLRECVLRLWREALPDVSVDDVNVLSRVVERAMARSADRYFEGRSKLLEGLEQIADAAFNEPDLDAFLARLLEIFARFAPSIDSVAILLRDGEELTARASIGLEQDVADGFTLRIGEGFAGKVAETRAPLLVKNAWQDPLVQSQRLRERKTSVLYGVPLLDGDEVVGVAHIGTREGEDIPRRERRLFAALAQRSTAAIIRHRLRRDVGRRGAELHAVIEAIPSAVFIGDRVRGLVMANEAALRSAGLSSAQELPKDMTSVAASMKVRDPTTGAPTKPEDTAFARALAGEENVVHDAIVWDRRANEDRYVRKYAGPVKEDGTVVGAVCVMADLTELHRAVEHMKRAAEFREQFVAIVSHDLRNPLQAIVMGASLLIKSPQLHPTLARSAGRVLANTERMGRMISDLLDFTRGQLGGGIPVTPRDADLREVTKRVVEEFELSHPAQTIACHFHGRTRGRWDPERLAQVLSNLIGNALQYGAPEEPIRVSVEGDAEQVILSVHNANAGAPIAPEELPQIFDPFRRLASAGESRGLGLGLFIASEIVRAHHGRIDVSSDGQGTTFVIQLPRDAAMPAPP